MNVVPVLNTIQMNSLEIATLVEKRHDNVKRTIETLVRTSVIALPPLVDEQSTDAFGRTRTTQVYLFTGEQGKRESYAVIAQLSPAHIGAAVDFWGRTKDALNELLAALESFDVPDDMHGMYVYAIRNTVTGSVKLGISRDPVQRVKQLQTGNDCLLELIACRKADNGFADEHAIHQENSQHHIRGEWFSSEVQEALK